MAKKKAVKKAGKGGYCCKGCGTCKMKGGKCCGGMMMKCK